MVYITRRSQYLWCPSYRGDNLCGVHHTAESRAIHFEKKLWGVHHTAKSISAVCNVHHTAQMISAMCIPPQRQSLRCAFYRRDKLHSAHRGVKIEDNFVIEYLSEIETKFENILAYLSGDQMGSNQEKN